EDERGEKRLVGYLVGAEVKGLSARAVRQFLKEKLPAYMAPSAYVMMEQLPLTANGKVDRKALPDPPRRRLFGGEGTTDEITPGSVDLLAGVGIEHRGLMNLVAWQCEQYSISSADRATQVANASSDAVSCEIWPYLLTGASVNIAEDDLTHSPEELARWLVDHQITITSLPGPAAETVLAQDWRPGCALRYMLVGGDGIRRYPPKAIGFELVNNYGLVENSGAAACGTIRFGSNSSGLPPVGRPVASSRIAILDQSLGLAPVGVPGQLYIGGGMLARGYPGLPGFTAGRFVPDPFQGAGDRLYRTGDLARYLPDGRIRLMGRMDQQLDIRGLHIEPAEIETKLKEHPSVRHAFVTGTGRRAEATQLVAYVELESDAPSCEELELFLRQSLPDEMVPAAILPLERFPMTHRGKIDRRALPVPDFSGLRSEYVPSRTETEKALCEVWAKALGLDQVGIRDNFFDLGGHSINAIQITTKAKEAGCKVSTRQILELQTIEKLAEVVTQPQTDAIAQPQSQDRIGEFAPLTPIQNWFFDREHAAPHQFNMALILQFQQEVDSGLLRTALDGVVKNHAVLAHRFKQETGCWRQLIAKEPEVLGFTEHDLGRLDESERVTAMETAAAQAHKGLDITRGPVMQAVLFRLGEPDPDCLLIVLHHLFCDVISQSIIAEDIRLAYTQLSKGKQIDLEVEGTTYARWAELLQMYGKSDQCKQDLNYWTSLSWAKARPIPLDYPNGENLAGSADAVEVRFTEAETRTLVRELPRAHNAQTVEALLTALALAYERWADSNTLIVAVERHGREELFDDVELSRTVGWFTSITPVILDMEDVYDEGQALKTVKERYRSMSVGGIGFGVLRYMSDDRDIRERMEQIPEPEISFNFLGQAQAGSVGMLGNGSKAISAALFSPASKRPFKLDISGVIEGGRLTITIIFSERLHRRARVEALALYYSEALRALIRHCSSARATEYTPADFQGVDLSQGEIDELVAGLSVSGD
ncbi:MAG TPA: condensation domain-containing protein, partial [Blastocatellia bacterium]|nr:condensation domain-containing protein [Blastocatellia bacterium]